MTDINFKVDGNWTNAALAIYKVGAIYMSVDSTSPATLFGGTWVSLEGRMLIGADSTYTAESTGGAATVTLTKEQSGLPAHGHGFTQPKVNGGAITNGITGGNHHHSWQGYYSCGDGGKQCQARAYLGGDPVDTTTTNAEHKHNLPAHTHSVSGGAVSNNSGANAAQAHDNMPPYLAVYMWKRTA